MEPSILMECPHCHEEIPGEECRDCGARVPLKSRYCMHCGTRLEAHAQGPTDHDDELDLENRILCPDGACTGIIIDGRCSECGKPFNGS